MSESSDFHKEFRRMIRDCQHGSAGPSSYVWVGEKSPDGHGGMFEGGTYIWNEAEGGYDHYAEFVDLPTREVGNE